MSISIALIPLLLQGLVPTALDRAADAQVFANDGAQYDGFGVALDLDGDTLAVGAPSTAGGGAVYVYRGSGGPWGFEAKLTGLGATLGYSVALQGERLVAGAPNQANSVGGARVFERSGTLWSEVASLSPAGTGTQSQYFGDAVGLDGDRIAVGAPLADGPVGDCGVAYVFEKVGGAWVQVAALTASDASNGDQFATAVALQGDTLVVGAPRRGPPISTERAGAAYVFERVAGVWTEQQILVGPITNLIYTAPAGQGFSLALDGDVLVAGANRTTPYGSAVVFERTTGSWSYVQTLISALPTAYAGSSVAVAGDTLAVGVTYGGVEPAQLGSIALWKRQSNGWRERERLLLSPPDPHARLGDSLALAGGRLVAGAASADGNASFTGAAYSFDSLPTWVGESFCPGDGSGTGCPCGMKTYRLRGPGCRHADGDAALLIARGSASVAADDLELVVTRIPPAQPALLVFRAQAANGGLGVKFQNGLLCVAGAGGRLGVVSNHVGDALWGPALGSQLAATAGGRAYFQVWYRDAAGSCGHGANLSNGIEVVFTP